MKKFEIFAGLGGGYNSVTSYGIEEHRNEEDATTRAYELAVEDYESHEGSNGLENFQDCILEAKSEYPQPDPGETEEEYEMNIDEHASELYSEYIETWIDYYVKEIKE